MFSDIRYAIRTLRQSPGFALTAIFSIALGIGPNSAIFSLQDGLLLRPLPIERASEVVPITSRMQNGSVDGFTYPDFALLRDKNQSFEGLVGYVLIGTGFAKDDKAQPDYRVGFLVSGNFFTVLGVQPVLGRGFHPDEDDVPGRDPVAVIAFDFWKKEFGGDPSIIGKHIRLGQSGGQDFTIIGVAPQSFTGMDQFFRPTFYIPNAMGPKVTGLADILTNRRYAGNGNLVNIKGRLKNGVSVQTANAEIAALAQAIERSFPDTNSGVRAAVRTELQTRVDYSPFLAGIVAAVSALMIVILAIACANVMNLMLSRGRARAREFGVRLAIGAGRSRLIRQLMAESVVIAVAGGVLGLLIAAAALRVFSTVEVPGEVPISLSFQLDSRVLVFTLAVCF